MSEEDSAQTIRATKLSYRCIVGSYYALLVLFLINSLSALDQLSPAIPVIWLLQSAPLLGFSRAIHRNISHAIDVYASCFNFYVFIPIHISSMCWETK